MDNIKLEQTYLNLYIEQNGINHKINDHMFINELIDYIYIPKEEIIKNLNCWIDDAKASNSVIGLIEMESDLEYLNSLNDKYIFSNVGTNEFIALSDNEERFYNIATEILKMQMFFDNCELNHLDLPNCKDEIEVLRATYDFSSFDENLSKFQSLSDSLISNGLDSIKIDKQLQHNI